MALLVPAIVLSLLVCLGVPGAVGALMWRSLTSSAASATSDAAAQLTWAPAVTLQINYLSSDGQSTTGTITVTSDRYASGTLTDPVAGRAEFRANPHTTVVRADEEWWSHRVPANAKALAGKWIRPGKAGMVGLPVVTALNPAALARLVRDIGAGTATTAEPVPFNGRQVYEITRGDWTMLVTADGSHDVLALSGPVGEDGALRPAVSTDTPDHVTPADDPRPATPPGLLLIDTPTGGGNLSLAPEPGDDDDAAKARQAAREALPEGPSAAPATEPPSDGDFTEPQPELDASTDSGDCNTPTCPVPWQVTNDGDGDCGNAQLALNAVGAGQEQVIPLGPTPAGATRTGNATFVNPAQPGQTIPVALVATPYCISLVPTDPKVDKNLRARGIDPNNSKKLRTVPPEDQGWMRRTLDRMTGANDLTPNDYDKALRTMENGYRDPEVRNYLRYLDTFHDRVLGWRYLTTVINGAIEAGIRNQLREAVLRLREDPRATVAIDTPEQVGGRKYQADNLYPDIETAVEMKTISSTTEKSFKRGLEDHVRTAVRQLNNEIANANYPTAPPDWRRHLLVILTDAVPPLWFRADKASLTQMMRQQQPFWKVLCRDGQPRIDRLLIENATGRHVWEPHEFRDIAGDACP